jgi:hypothetical protein
MRHLEGDAFLDTSDSPLKFGLEFGGIGREFFRKTPRAPGELAQ